MFYKSNKHYIVVILYVVMVVVFVAGDVMICNPLFNWILKYFLFCASFLSSLFCFGILGICNYKTSC